MTTKFLLILFFSLLSINVSAAKKIPGFIITGTDSLAVTFKISITEDPRYPNEPDYLVLQRRVKYIDSTDQVQTLRPEDAERYVFEFNNYKVVMVSMSYHTNSKPNMFIREVADGTNLNLYSLYTPQPKISTTELQVDFSDYYRLNLDYALVDLTYYFQKEGESFVRIKPRNKKFYKQYFADCPHLSEKINNKKYAYGGQKNKKGQKMDIVEDLHRKLTQMVLDYNVECN